jgi:hypothetical protein
MEQVNDKPVLVVMQETIKLEQPNPKSEQTTASKPQVSSPMRNSCQTSRRHCCGGAKP